MSRPTKWDLILPLLPKALRDAALLDRIASLEAQFEASRCNGNYALRLHYAGGSLQCARIEPPVEEFRPSES